MSNSRIISVFLSLAMVALVSGATAPTASAITIADIQAQILALQAQLTALQGTPTTGYAFSADLKLGSTGDAVKQLQIMLNKDAATQVAASGVGSSGSETTYFGPLTKAAVIKFQTKYAADVLTPIGLTTATGYVGSMTRAKLNTMGGVATPTTPTTPGVTPVVPQGTGLTVTAGVQPLASLAPLSATRVPLTVVNFTASYDGDITVNSLTVERTGLAADAAISGVILLDENGIQLGLEKTLNSLHQAVLSEPFTIKAGTTKAMTIAINRPSAVTTSYAGQIAYFSLVGVNTSATVNGALPITGTGMTINESLTLGSVTVAAGSLDPGANNTSKNIGTTGFVFSSIKVTAGAAEKVRLSSIRWNQSGSAAAGDIANIATYVDGIAYPTTVSSDGKYYTSTFGTGIVIDKGMYKEISIKGDIVSGSARTIEFDVYKATDLAVKGETYGYGILPPSTGTASTQGAFAAAAGASPWYYAYTATVSAGTIAVSKAVSVAAQNIAINLASQPLGGFDVEVKGEPVSVGKMIFTIATGTAGTSADLLTNVAFYDQNGAVIAGPVNAEAGTGAVNQTVTFTDTVTFPIGKYTYALKGQLPTTVANTETFVVSHTPSTAWTTVKGQTTGVTIIPSPASPVAASTMTAKTAVVAITVSGTPAIQSVVAGAQNFIFANYQFDATGSGEDVRYNSLKLQYTFAGDNEEYLTSCQLYDGSTALNTGSNVSTFATTLVNAADVTFTLDSGGLVVTKGTVKTIALKCNISANADGKTYKWGLQTAAQGGTGLISGQTAATTGTATNAGSLMTVTDAGTLAATSDSSAPSYTIIPAGITGWTDGAIRFSATNEDINLQYVALDLADTASASDIIKVYLYDGATKVAEGIFAGASLTTLLTLNPTVTIPKDGYKVLTVKADINTIDANTAAAREGAFIKIGYNGDSTTSGVGLASGTTITEASADFTFSGARAFKSYPTFARIAVPSTTLITGTMDIYRFSITASPSSGNGIGLYGLTVNIATSTAGDTIVTAKNLKIYAYTDSGFSNPVSAFTNGLIAPPATVAGFVSGNISTTTVSNTILQIPAGQTIYFRVIADTTITATTYAPTGSLTTYINGDTAYPVFTPSTQLMSKAATSTLVVSGTFGSKLIWTPNATTTSTLTHRDWTNGYGVSGLPSTGMDSVTISK